MILMSIECTNSQESDNQMKEEEYNGEALTLLSIATSSKNTLNHKKVQYTMEANSSFIK